MKVNTAAKYKKNNRKKSVKHYLISSQLNTAISLF